MRWNSLNARRKSSLVLLMTIAVLFIAFLSPINRTIEVMRSCNDLEFKIEEAKKAPIAIAELNSIKESWTKNMVINLTDDELQLKLFEIIGTVTADYETHVYSIKQVELKSDTEYSSQTFEVIINGSFQKMLNVLHQLEQDMKLGKIVSVSFNIKKMSDNEEELFMQMLVQSATKKSP